ncbi:hypothetical protein L2719_05315 [Shewanella schlegeliana]|uniref:Uncharacterized protein n=1 Tax=Shewanella schlegeliana TaxID=190308 RepID=A0ABS1SWQ7_9GAMM|nr:hypothetical protein [Shewanella schlegeliana]MBL4912937.1 hypothetical protein [Shewanella schlegeliana]MCL1108967.1 hypothetical protein [Shewanella schlegeliana]GIU23510.1 hypothetical protein TUM4433_06080 [Shewanella schlegeliana]
MYIQFNQDNISALLPEKRPATVFTNPDLFIVFDKAVRFVLWQEIIDKLPAHWLADKDLWDSDFDFGSAPDDEDGEDTENESEFDDYKTLELLQFPTLAGLDVDVDVGVGVGIEAEEKHAFVYDTNHALYISEDFIKDLKSAGCINIWYNTTAPFGRY